MDVGNQQVDGVLNHTLAQGETMKLSDRLAELMKACFTGIWIESHEHDDALLEINGLCRDNEWRLMTWDIDQGLKSGRKSAWRGCKRIRSVGGGSFDAFLRWR